MSQDVLEGVALAIAALLICLGFGATVAATWWVAAHVVAWLNRWK